jgi:hypothetical protein
MISTSNVTKTYDGGLTAAGSATVTGGTLYTGDTLSGGTFAFTNKNVGSGNKIVTVGGVTVNDGNNLGGNYNVSYADNITSTINPYVVSMTGSRTYDGTASVAAGIFTLGTLVGTETLTLSGTGTVANKNVGSGKTVTLGSLALGNGSNSGVASNYTFTGGTQTANITSAPLTLSTSNVTKTYDGGLTAAGSATVTGGTLYTGDTLSGGTFAFTNKNVGSGNKTVTTSGVTVTDGNSGNNYNVSYANNNTSTINPADLSVTANADSKTYDGLAYSGGNGVAYSGFVTGETSSVLSGPLAYSGSSQGAINLGSYVITPGGLTSGNYIISYYNGALTINQATSSIPQQNAYNNILYVTVLNFNGTTTTTFIKGGQNSGIKKQALPYCN